MSDGRCQSHSDTRKVQRRRSPRGEIRHDYRYKKALPAILADRFEELAARHDYVSLREDIALASLRVERAIQELSCLDSFTLRELEKLVSTGRNLADSDADSVEWAGWFDRLLPQVESAVREKSVWREIEVAQEHRKRLVDSERRYLELEGQQISAEQAFGLIGAVLACVFRHVVSEKAKAAIAEDIDGLLAASNRQTVEYKPPQLPMRAIP